MANKVKDSRPVVIQDNPDLLAAWGRINPKRQRFLVCYLKTLNAAKAARMAGYSAGCAREQGSYILTFHDVRLIVQADQNRRLEELGIDDHWILSRIKKLADFDTRKLYNKDGSLKSVTSLDEDTAFALQGMDMVERSGEDGEVTRVKKYKLADKGQNLERLGRYRKLFTDKSELSGPGGVPLIPPVLDINFVSPGNKDKVKGEKS